MDRSSNRIATGLNPYLAAPRHAHAELWSAAGHWASSPNVEAAPCRAHLGEPRQAALASTQRDAAGEPDPSWICARLGLELG